MEVLTLVRKGKKRILLCWGKGKKTGRNSEVENNFAEVAFTLVQQEGRLLAEVGGLRLVVREE